MGIGYAFTDWNGIGWSAHPVGLANFIKIFSLDEITRTGVIHTLLICVLMVAFSNIIGLLLAIVLQQRFKFRSLYRALFFLPFAMSYLATGYIWKYILTFEGPFNQFLGMIGLQNLQRPWLADPNTALYMVVIVMVWQYIGLTLVIYLAGLEGIPEELHDATAVDGATKWMKFKRVTLPLLTPAITVATLLTMVWGLAIFDQIISLTGGGPVNSTETLATLVYKNSFIYGNFGYGSALAVVLAILVTCFALLQNALARKKEEALS